MGGGERSFSGDYALFILYKREQASTDLPQFTCTGRSTRSTPEKFSVAGTDSRDRLDTTEVGFFFSLRTFEGFLPVRDSQHAVHGEFLESIHFLGGEWDFGGLQWARRGRGICFFFALAL